MGVTTPIRDEQTAYAGTHLGRYRLDELVASSAMADLFRATDQRTGQRVAVKIPHLEVRNNPALLERFTWERRVLQFLDHPGIVKVIPQRKRSRPYFVMEWIEGQPLRQILNQRGKLRPERAAAIAQQACDALYHVHREGLVHRDLKPENIMITARDEVKLIDFGIAIAPRFRQAMFSPSASIMGTPDYISPEQVRGKQGSGRTDIYSLGVVLYEMVASRLPFSGANPFLVMNDRLLNDPIPPRAFEPAVSARLEEIILRALQRDPNKRYATAHEMACDLQCIEDPQLPSLRPQRRWWRFF